ncbi:hypothetical protein P38_3821 [Pseudomonas aeruginosa MH38]|nr:hypothetical protein P38_3821 [Pseudomonas aeruginosa MH38]
MPPALAGVHNGRLANGQGSGQVMLDKKPAEFS